MPEMNPVDDQILHRLCKILLHTDLTIHDVLSACPIPNCDPIQYEQAIFYNALLEFCTVCNHWVGSCSMEWNLDAACCVMCLEYSSEYQRG